MTEESTKTPSTPELETHEFKAEIKQLLEILIHSVYTSKDIFIRELISNATDALEKLRFGQVSGQQIYEPEATLEIRISSEEKDDRQVLVIADTGIGMTAEEVQTNIGTIAHSGAAAFLEQMKQSQASEAAEDPEGGDKMSLIGRFGVGFYSVFMAAERVVLTSRSAEPAAETVVWTSEGLGNYSIGAGDPDAPRGTRIEIHLKKEEDRFADLDNVKSAIQRYSNFVPFPILVDDEQINQTTALWREPSFQVKAEQYNEFYKLISHDMEDPLLKMHYSVDVPLQFSALLFVPARNFEVMGFGAGEVSLQLYVKRVLIDGDNKDLLPKYLRFARGVVESEDLPLNVSRETLQENRIVASIRKNLTTRLLDQLLNLSKEQPEQYTSFWTSFGRILKEGYQDLANREKLQQLLRFNTSRHDDDQGLISLSDYVEKMPEGQKAIYYLSGPSRDALLRDARLELFRKKNIEVIYLTDVADEFVLSSLGDFSEKKLISADQVKLDDLSGIGDDSSDDESQKKEEKDQADLVDVRPLIKAFKEILGEQVIDVRESQRLVDSPSCLVGDEDQMSSHMDKMLRMMNDKMDLPKRVLEINPSHALIQHLASLVADQGQRPFIENACRQLFEGAMLVDGYLTDPHQLVRRMNEVLEDAAQLRADQNTPPPSDGGA